ncbi:MAG: hypothetical protein LBL67_06005 [Coriobacteriales bacterium]|jgi:hypothetical protein|nr:hypothetical protein [Coriobacteriales bacterium]
MACFLVPTTEAVVTTIIKKRLDKKEATLEAAGQTTEAETAHDAGKLSWHTKLSWLNTMLWGGAVLLLLEHIWHGEITFAFPFFTKGPAEIFPEMATVGVTMAIVVTLVWAVAVFAIEHVPALHKLVTRAATAA